MHPQNRLPALQIRQLHRNPPVKPARTQQRGVQGFRTVGRRQDHHTLFSVEPVHFSQQLVQRLLPLIIAPDRARAVPLLSDGVNLIDKDDAGRLLIRLLEQVPHLGGTHAHKHLDELGAGNGKEGDLRFSRHRSGQQCLAGSGRAYQQRAFGQLRADTGIFIRMLQKIHDFLQRVLGFLLSRDIREGHAGLLVRHDLRVGFPEGQGVHAAAHPLSQLIAQQTAQPQENGNGQNPAEQKAQQGVVLRRDFRAEAYACLPQPFNQPVIRKQRCLVKLLLSLVILRHKNDLVRFLGQGNLGNSSFLHPFQKITVPDRLHLPGQHQRNHKRIQQQQDGRHDHHIKDQRLSGSVIIMIVFQHSVSPPFPRASGSVPAGSCIIIPFRFQEKPCQGGFSRNSAAFHIPKSS